MSWIIDAAFNGANAALGQWAMDFKGPSEDNSINSEDSASSKNENSVRYTDLTCKTDANSNNNLLEKVNSAFSCSFSSTIGCIHNDRLGVSIADVVEHIGNQDIGSAARDIADLASGHQDFVGFNQPPCKESESSQEVE